MRLPFPSANRSNTVIVSTMYLTHLSKHIQNVHLPDQALSCGVAD